MKYEDQSCYVLLKGCDGQDVSALQSHQLLHRDKKHNPEEPFYVPACRHCKREMATGFMLARAARDRAWDLAFFRWMRHAFQEGLVKWQ